MVNSDKKGKSNILNSKTHSQPSEKNLTEKEPTPPQELKTSKNDWHSLHTTFNQHFTTAEAHIRTRNWSAAIAELDEAHKAHPFHAQTLAYLAMIYRLLWMGSKKVSDRKTAKQYADFCLQIEPSNPLALSIARFFRQRKKKNSSSQTANQQKLTQDLPSAEKSGIPPKSIPSGLPQKKQVSIVPKTKEAITTKDAGDRNTLAEKNPAVSAPSPGPREKHDVSTQKTSAQPSLPEQSEKHDVSIQASLPEQPETCDASTEKTSTLLPSPEPLEKPMIAAFPGIAENSPPKAEKSPTPPPSKLSNEELKALFFQQIPTDTAKPNVPESEVSEPNTFSQRDKSETSEKKASQRKVKETKSPASPSFRKPVKKKPVKPKIIIPGIKALFPTSFLKTGFFSMYRRPQTPRYILILLFIMGFVIFSNYVLTNNPPLSVFFDNIADQDEDEGFILYQEDLQVPVRFMKTEESRGIELEMERSDLNTYQKSYSYRFQALISAREIEIEELTVQITLLDLTEAILHQKTKKVIAAYMPVAREGDLIPLIYFRHKKIDEMPDISEVQILVSDIVKKPAPKSYPPSKNIPLVWPDRPSGMAVILKERSSKFSRIYPNNPQPIAHKLILEFENMGKRDIKQLEFLIEYLDTNDKIVKSHQTKACLSISPPLRSGQVRVHRSVTRIENCPLENFKEYRITVAHVR